jgi:hypothetical protein
MTFKHAELNAAFAEVNRAVLLEDLDVLPGMQHSIDHGGIDSLCLSYQERRIYYLHETIDRVIGPDRLSRYRERRTTRHGSSGTLGTPPRHTR